jgi:hypothetical protein
VDCNGFLEELLKTLYSPTMPSRSCLTRLAKQLRPSIADDIDGLRFGYVRLYAIWNRDWHRWDDGGCRAESLQGGWLSLDGPTLEAGLHRTPISHVEIECRSSPCSCRLAWRGPEDFASLCLPCAGLQVSRGFSPVSDRSATPIAFKLSLPHHAAGTASASMAGLADSFMTRLQVALGEERNDINCSKFFG